MEILSYVLSGELSHKDSESNTGVIRPGDVQHMTAGSGIKHSEFNASETDPAHFLQIWIIPDKRGVPPRYEDLTFPLEKRKNRLCLIASPDKAEVSLEVAEGRGVWVQVARGEVGIGHGFGAEAAAELLVFDLA